MDKTLKHTDNNFIVVDAEKDFDCEALNKKIKQKKDHAKVIPFNYLGEAFSTQLANKIAKLNKHCTLAFNDDQSF